MISSCFGHEQLECSSFRLVGACFFASVKQKKKELPNRAVHATCVPITCLASYVAAAQMQGAMHKETGEIRDKHSMEFILVVGWGMRGKQEGYLHTYLSLIVFFPCEEEDIIYDTPGENCSSANEK